MIEKKKKIIKFLNKFNNDYSGDEVLKESKAIKTFCAPYKGTVQLSDSSFIFNSQISENYITSAESYVEPHFGKKLKKIVGMRRKGKCKLTKINLNMKKDPTKNFNSCRICCSRFSSFIFETGFQLEPYK